ncbi:MULTISPECIES: ferric reductase-like transmembrane domain-containing protein [Marinovum]|uniref:ferric reductase-like transmembrane domain-containing protein n=1 Tax=Marinovum TaxID=367771 RepID=UPI00237B53F5|nr:ferric reductase-like transmembrane domain-containing protein [Marinovum sp. PR37]MDD9746943.1 ferric reductase-like transmembrane domain-containing protein [Marinovum sp. PR37]
MTVSPRRNVAGFNLKSYLLSSWWARHLIVILIGAAGTWLFLYSRSEWSPMHRWNRAVGDMSIVLVAAAMSLGPVSRLWRSTAVLLPYRRELGIYAVLLAFIHATIILIGWVNLDLMRLVGFEFHPGLQRYVMVQHGFAIANLIGVLALLYGLILAGTSNDRSLRWMGSSVWKFVQRGTYVLWWLSVVHTGYFLYLHFLDFHRATPEPNWVQWPFAGLVGTVLALQIVASSATLYKVRRRGSAAS